MSEQHDSLLPGMEPEAPEIPEIPEAPETPEAPEAPGGELPHYEVIRSSTDDPDAEPEKFTKTAEKLSAGSNEKEEGSWRRVPVAIKWPDKARIIMEFNPRATRARFSMARPPEGHEETFNDGIFREVLEKCRIVYGVDGTAIKNMLSDIPASLPYDAPVIIASGSEPIPGTDGEVRELFPRVAKPRFEERPDGTIDFKNLHLVQNVERGTVICEITPPVPGVPGTTVNGNPIRPAPPRSPAIPRGENVDLVDGENNSMLVAAIDGNLVYRNSRFCVESVYTVDGNVDISVGHIEFSGNVVVKGDVFEGFSIKTEKDVTVHGMVEGAHIEAGGNIILQHGMNGMGKGVLDAKGEITAKFLENCTVCAGGGIKAEEIIHCTVETDGGISLEGRGKLVGGRITAFGSINAKVIGTPSNHPIHVTLGVTPQMVHKRERLKEQLDEVTAEHESLTRDVIFLEQPKYTNSVDHQKRLDDYRGRLNLVSFKKRRLENKLRQLTDEQETVVTSTLTCKEVHPPFRLTIGPETLKLYDSASMCRFYMSESGEITMGML